MPPHETVVAMSATAPESFLSWLKAVMVRLLTFGDARRDEDEELRVFVAHGVAPEQPLDERNAAQTRHAVVVVVILTGVDAADDGRLTVVDEHRRRGALRVDRRHAVEDLADRSVVDRDLHDDG